MFTFSSCKLWSTTGRLGGRAGGARRTFVSLFEYSIHGRSGKKGTLNTNLASQQKVKDCQNKGIVQGDWWHFPDVLWEIFEEGWLEIFPDVFLDNICRWLMENICGRLMGNISGCFMGNICDGWWKIFADVWWEIFPDVLWEIFQDDWWEMFADVWWKIFSDVLFMGNICNWLMGQQQRHIQPLEVGVLDKFQRGADKMLCCSL